MRDTRLVFQPQTAHSLQRGTRQLVEAIRPTLGPLPRVVAYANGDLRPELLDNGGVIARRIIQLTDADADVGAMILRQMLWELSQKAGDGTATAAVIFQSILDDGLRYVAAGGNAMRLRHSLEDVLKIVTGELERLAQPLDHFKRAANSLCHDPSLAAIIGEIFDVLGPYAQVEIVDGHSRDDEREYIPGTFWPLSGVLSPSLLTDLATGSVSLNDAVVLATDFDIEEPHELEEPIRAAFRLDARALVVVARSISDKVVGFLQSARDSQRFHLVCVKTPGNDAAAQMQSLEELTLLVGGRPLLRAAGQTLNAVRDADLGRAGRVWATRFNFGIEDGAGNLTRLDTYTANLQIAADHAIDMAARRQLWARLGHFLGAAAIIRIGGISPIEIKMRHEQAQRALEVMRSAGIQGVVPGGGSSLLNISRQLTQQAYGCQDDDNRVAYRIIARALKAPITTLLQNAGVEPALVMAELESMSASAGYDVVQQTFVDVFASGIVDALPVIQAAVQSAVQTAALCLTLDVIVHHRHPEQAINP